VKTNLGLQSEHWMPVCACFLPRKEGAIMRVVRAVVRRTRPEKRKTVQKQRGLVLAGCMTWGVAAMKLYGMCRMACAPWASGRYGGSGRGVHELLFFGGFAYTCLAETIG